MVDIEFIKQTKNVTVTKQTVIKTFIGWDNTEEGRDNNDIYEKVGDCFINIYNRNNRISHRHEFYSTLNAIYLTAERENEKV